MAWPVATVERPIDAPADWTEKMGQAGSRPRRRSSADPLRTGPRPGTQVGFQSGDSVEVAVRFLAGVVGGFEEYAQPLPRGVVSLWVGGWSDMPPGVEPSKVGVAGSGENRAYGRHERWGDTGGLTTRQGHPPEKVEASTGPPMGVEIRAAPISRLGPSAHGHRLTHR